MGRMMFFPIPLTPSSKGRGGASAGSSSKVWGGASGKLFHQGEGLIGSFVWKRAEKKTVMNCFL